MKLLSNIHTHSTWCDGTDEPRELAERAIELGFTDLGFSSHAPTPFDPGCPGIRSEKEYRDDIAQIKGEYAGKVNISCGIEQDRLAPVNAMDYDYVIGSNHYVQLGQGSGAARVPVDATPEELEEAIASAYNGDALALARDFYAQTVAGVRESRPAVVGHFDLLVKFNRDGRFFDETKKVYQALALEALDETLDVLRGYGGL
ncbi:MAG: PHP domain-containing protein, partial [Oscillospiraceae bacterium]